jgi:calcineurin-like phosphoesterase family protein
MIYFSSDWHLDHANVIKYDKRPYKNVEAMNEDIIANLNVLQKGDTLYYLGDFAFTRSSNAAEGHMKAVALIGANLFFIKGNHDKRDTIKLYERYGVYLGEQKKIKIADKDAPNELQEIVLNHYAMRVWDKSHHGTWHLYGHSHDGLDDKGDYWGMSMDCGVPSAYRIKGQYEPFSYEEIKEIMKTRKPKIIDHHGRHDRV